MATNYPIAADQDDPRFTIGLLADILDVLDKHGYPRPTGADTSGVMVGLFRMLYRGR